MEIHVRVALCFSTLAIVLVAVATAGTCRRRPFARILFGGITVAYVLAFVGLPRVTHDLFPPSVSAWLANAAMVAMSLLLFTIGAVRATAGRRVV